LYRVNAAIQSNDYRVTSMRQWTVDAFASRPFKGNPACVVDPFDAWPPAERLQALAAENNQAETAFLLKTADPARFGLRWMTPTVEAQLCGHATLASAHVLFTELGVEAQKLTFDTLSGPLIVERLERGYRMDFPSNPPMRIDPPSGLAEALSVPIREVWMAQYLLVVVESEACVRAANPDLAVIKAISSDTTGGRGNVGVSAVADAGASYDVVSRFFAPGSGIPEDPTTGSFHCIAAPLFADKLGRARLGFHQAYPGRGGDLVCETRGDRVWLEGEAVTVIASRLRITL
jgi:predicted PhzF superfamily epimerase YddE/YHI9